MILTRRSALLGMSSLMVLSACETRSGAGTDAHKAQIDALANPFAEAPAVPAAGLTVRREGETIFSYAAGTASGLGDRGIGRLGAFTPDSPFRVASISKTVTAATALALARQGALQMDAHIGDYFDGGLRNPAYPSSPITLGHLLNHTSTLRDPDVYWMASPGRTADLFTPDMFAEEGPPGRYFSYCNLGYGLAAAVMEKATGERFDRLAHAHFLKPAGMSEAGFNWAGVSEARLANAATLYRHNGDEWVTQVDGAADLLDPGARVLLEEGFALDAYEVGSNGTLFSPQGGLRASLSDLINLAAYIGREPDVSGGYIWRLNSEGTNGDSDEGYFTAYGAGVHVFSPEASPLKGQEMIGHFGEAYGLYAGAFYLPRINTEIAFAVTGTPEDGPAIGRHPCLNIYTQLLVDIAGEVLEL